MFDTVQARYQSESDLAPRRQRWGFQEQKRFDENLNLPVETRTSFLNDTLCRLWIHNGKTLKFETSLPKILYGNNFRLLHDPTQAIRYLDEFIQDHVKGVQDTVLNFPYSRVDYCHNFDAGRENIPRYIKAFSKLSPLPNKRLYNGDETISFHSNGRMIRIYNKEKELYASKCPESEQARGILRFEVQIRRRSKILERFLKCGKTSLLVRDVIDTNLAHQMLKKHIELIRVDIPITAKQRAFDILTRRIKGPMAYELYGLYDALNSQNLDKVKETLPTATYYRLKKRLKEEGVLLQSDGTEYLPPLVLPEKDELLEMCET